MIKIDLENHFYDESLLEELIQRKTPPFYNKDKDIIKWTDNIEMPQGVLLEKLLEVGEQRIELFKELGITKAVLSSSPGPEELDEESSIKVCRATNDALGEIVNKNYGKFYGSAILPVKNVEVACEEMKRCVKEYGFVAWHTHSNYGDTSPDNEKYFPLFEKAAELGIYVYLHPQLPKTNRVEGYGFTFAGPALGFTLDASTTLLRLIVSGISDKLPNLKVVIGHLGEGIPFLLDRISNRIKFIPNPQINMEHDIKYYFEKNIWVTTSGNMSKEAFKCTKDVLGIERMLFASDYPYENAEEMMEFLDEVSMTEKERQILFYENAVNSLNIK